MALGTMVEKLRVVGMTAVATEVEDSKVVGMAVA
jgi:hypothetical protein